MKFGFTGTQDGAFITNERLFSLCQLLEKHRPTEFHHGDCIGADAKAHVVALLLKRTAFPNLKIHIHPPINESKRAFCQDYDVMHPSRPYLDRNRDIVDASDFLIVMPKDTDQEELRSGTWSTWRYAKNKNIHWTLI